MELLSRPALFDRYLARLATGCLGGSLVAVCFFLLFTKTAIARPQWMISLPIATVAVLLGAIAYSTSAYVLAQLSRRSVANPRQLWRISLGSNVLIVVLVPFVVGVQTGLIVSIPELMGIALHVVALIKQPPHAAQSHR